MHVSYLPRAVAAGARIRAGVEADRVLVEDGRAVGVSCSTRRRRRPRAAPFTVRARRAVIVAGGALGTPELLLRSGLGGAPGRPQPPHPPRLLGRRPLRGGGARLGRRDAELLRRPVGARSGILLEATFTPLAFGGAWLLGAGRSHQRAMLDFGHVGSIGVHLSDRSSGRVGLGAEGSLRASYKLTGEDADRLAFGIARAAEVHFAAGATEVYPNIARVGVLKPGDLAEFEATRFKPAELRLEAFHPMGTARIAADPREGACAADGSVHGTRDLYVADASLFPTSVGVNPMMTIIAFAKQVARGVAEGVERQPLAAAARRSDSKTLSAHRDSAEASWSEAAAVAAVPSTAAEGLPPPESLSAVPLKLEPSSCIAAVAAVGDAGGGDEAEEDAEFERGVDRDAAEGAEARAGRRSGRGSAGSRGRRAPRPRRSSRPAARSRSR